MDRKTLIVIFAHTAHENIDGVNQVISMIRKITPRELYEIDVEWNRGEGLVVPPNRGMRKAQLLGYDVVIMGDDTEIKDNKWLQKMQELAYSDDKIAMVNTTIIRRNFTHKDNTKEDFELGLGLVFIKNETLNKLGLHDENFISCGTEIDYSIQIKKAGLRIKEINVGFTNKNIEVTQNKVFGKETIQRFQKEAIAYRNLKWGFIDEH